MSVVPSCVYKAKQKPLRRSLSAERTLQSFNTWAFKREQPTEPELLLRAVGTAAAQQKPITFVLYWGKGPRATVAGPEVTCFDFLAHMVRRIKCAYSPGAAITLILTDTHAALNGHGAESVANYFRTVKEAADAYDFSSCHLSEIVRSDERKVWDTEEQPDFDILSRLEKCAAKWYRGEHSPAIGAAEYYRMNMVEKKAIEQAFPQAIFVTFNGSEYRELFPTNLPVFYMYSLRKGISVKPWFVDDTLHQAA